MIYLEVAGRPPVKLQATLAQMIPAMKRGIDKATTLLEREVRSQLSLGGSMPRTRKGRARALGMHVKSSLVPSWIPNTGAHLRVMDGTLRRSWRARRAQIVAGGVEGVVGSDVIYARIHEYGGQAGRNHATTIRPRPYAGPAIAKTGDEMVRAIVAEIMKPLR
jgi:phage gpG-like protein